MACAAIAALFAHVEKAVSNVRIFARSVRRNVPIAAMNSVFPAIFALSVPSQTGSARTVTCVEIAPKSVMSAALSVRIAAKIFVRTAVNALVALMNSVRTAESV